MFSFVFNLKLKIKNTKKLKFSRRFNFLILFKIITTGCLEFCLFKVIQNNLQMIAYLLSDSRESRDMNTNKNEYKHGPVQGILITKQEPDFYRAKS